MMAAAPVMLLPIALGVGINYNPFDLKYFFINLLLVVLLISCRFKGAKNITEAYSYCNGAEEGEKYYYHIDTLQTILKKGKGRFAPYTFLKSSYSINIKDKSGKIRVVQLSGYGKKLSFHYLDGKKQNIRYTVNDTTLTKQWNQYRKNIKQPCKDN